MFERTGDDLVQLHEAVRSLTSAARPVERALAHAELGAALRRTGRAEEAREPLRLAVDLARRCGATRLEEWAFGELRAAGARPRRRLISGTDALTPAERRVAELAAAGQMNREIAETLVVTLSTVEWHLRHVDRKLGITSRSKLGEALAAKPQRVRIKVSMRMLDRGWTSRASAATCTA